MPTNEKVRVFATGQGSYSVSRDAPLLAQSSSPAAVYNAPVFSVPPYVSGVLPGWSIGTKPAAGTSLYGVIRAVTLTSLTIITGVANGATATLQIYRAGASAATAATLAFTSGGVVASALTPRNIPVSATLANVQVRFGDLLVFRWTQGSTGLALPAAIVSVDLI